MTKEDFNAAKSIIDKIDLCEYILDIIPDIAGITIKTDEPHNFIQLVNDEENGYLINKIKNLIKKEFSQRLYMYNCQLDNI